MEKCGVLAGKGVLPLEVAKGIHLSGLEPVIIGLQEEVDPYLEEAGFFVTKVSLGELGKILNHLQNAGVKRLMMVGRVGKGALFSNLKIDEEFQKILAQLTIKNTDAILLAIVDYFEEHGIKVGNQTEFVDHLVPKEGLLTGEPLSFREKEDVKYGFEIAREIGRLDIGQSVIVKNGVVLAVESMEGTDRTIQRGGELGGEGTIVVKVAKPHQDLRFDVPVIGMDTLDALLRSKARVLAIEAEKTIILDRDELLAKAEEHGISVVALVNASSIDK
jgi:DUF1009 family protein